MTISAEMLAAYADGELGPEEVTRVEAAMAANPALTKQVEAHRRLRATLSDHFARVLDMPVPETLRAAVENGSNIVDLAAARAAKAKVSTTTRFPSFPKRHWAMGGAIAASLVIGVLIGGRLPGGGMIGSDGVKLMAKGTLDTALTTQLASAHAGEGVHILLSFRTEHGDYCRGFEAGETAGIACHSDKGWALTRTQAVPSFPDSGNYRQAGSAAAEILAAAQDMAPAGALSADAERAARDNGWHN